MSDEQLDKETEILENLLKKIEELVLTNMDILADNAALRDGIDRYKEDLSLLGTKDSKNKVDKVYHFKVKLRLPCWFFH